MSHCGLVLGFADFRLPLPAGDVARILSDKVFGGIPFVDTDDDNESGIANMKLQNEFCGIVVVFFGVDFNYSIEVSTRPSKAPEDASGICDLSGMLIHQLSSIAGITFPPPIYD